jgi:hypothetical protein
MGELQLWQISASSCYHGLLRCGRHAKELFCCDTHFLLTTRHATRCQSGRESTSMINRVKGACTGNRIIRSRTAGTIAHSSVLGASSDSPLQNLPKGQALPKRSRQPRFDHAVRVEENTLADEGSKCLACALEPMTSRMRGEQFEFLKRLATEALKSAAIRDRCLRSLEKTMC